MITKQTLCLKMASTYQFCDVKAGLKRHVYVLQLTRHKVAKWASIYSESTELPVYQTMDELI